MNSAKFDAFLTQLSTSFIGDRLFAEVPDILYCVKGLDRRYLAANRAFADKLNLKSITDIIGKTADELFPAHLASTYNEQDDVIFYSGDEMVDRLELVISKKGKLGWHLSSKYPLDGKEGGILGIVSTSRDLKMPSDEDLRFSGLAKVVAHIQRQYASSINVSLLANEISLTVTQLNRRMHKIFKLTTTQFIRKTRITAAANALNKTDKPISRIAQESGYSDQSAFTRQFSATVGMSPGAYRSRS